LKSDGTSKRKDPHAITETGSTNTVRRDGQTLLPLYQPTTAEVQNKFVKIGKDLYRF
jgi:hypothetical protein